MFDLTSELSHYIASDQQAGSVDLLRTVIFSPSIPSFIQATPTVICLAPNHSQLLCVVFVK